MTTIRQLLAIRGTKVGHNWEFLRFTTDADRTETDFRYGRDFDDNRGTWEGADVVGHAYLTSSDYSGGSVVRANQKAIEQEIDDTDEESNPLPHGIIVRAHGGHNTLAVYFRLDMDHKDADKVLEILDGLDDYPSIDDEILSEVENEEETESWESYRADDYLRSLEARFGLERGDVEIEKDSLGQLFHMVDGGQGLIVHEEGPGVYFDTDRAAEKTPAVFLFYLGNLEPLDIERVLENPDDARRILRLQKAGLTLRSLRDRVASLLPNKTETGDEILGNTFTASRWILDAKVEAGDFSAGLDREALERPADRSFSLTFSRWTSAKVETLTVTLDPFDNGASVYDGAPKIIGLFSRKE